MTFKTLDEFEAEFDSIKRKLGTDRRRDEAVVDAAPEKARCDVVLPYSTLPPLAGRRWCSA